MWRGITCVHQCQDLPCGRFIGNEASGGLGRRYLESSPARPCTSILDTMLTSSFQTTPLTLAEYPEGNERNESGLNCFRQPQQSGGGGGRLRRRGWGAFYGCCFSGLLYTGSVLSLCLTYLSQKHLYNLTLRRAYLLDRWRKLGLDRN